MPIPNPEPDPRHGVYGDCGAVEMTLTPNPANAMVQVALDAEMAALEVFDAMGNRVFSCDKGGKNFSFNVSSWPKGLYTVTAFNKETSVSKKLSVQ